MDFKYFNILFLSCLLFTVFACSDDDLEPLPSYVAVAENIDKSDVRAADIPSLFASKKVRYNAVFTLNWHDAYPYLPQVDFAIAHNGKNLLIHYRVTEKRTIGTMENDLEGVYKESCCEFFCMEKGDNRYYNIESNCLGSILMECGTGRSNREQSTLKNLAQIDRWASLGRKSVGIINSETHWELAMVVPLSAFWCHDYGSFSQKIFFVNVYNCVGSGDDRQYVTWFPIETSNPDFHRPEYFQPIYFE